MTEKDDAVPYSEFLGLPAPFMDYVGLKTYLADNGQRRMVLRLERRHLNAAMNTHGGVILTLLDVAMGSASRLHDPAGRSTVTVEMKTSFLRPGGSEGGYVEASGLVRHATNSLAFCEAELRDEGGELLATASGTFKFIQKIPTASDG